MFTSCFTIAITFLFIVYKGRDFFQTWWLLKEPFWGCKLFFYTGYSANSALHDLQLCLDSIAVGFNRLCVVTGSSSSSPFYFV